MKWIVTNALNRDVERQQLNKILAEIRTVCDDLAVKTNTTSTTVNMDALAQAVEGNIEEGIAVTYNPASKTLDFVVNDFTIRLAGDVTGEGVVSSLSSITIDTSLDPSAMGIGDAPIDNNFYWRQNGAWEPVDQGLAAFSELHGTGFPAQRQDTTEGETVWDLRVLQPPAAGITITNPAGEAGDPTFVLANDLAAVEGLSTIGIAVRTALDTWTTRSLAAPAAGFTITNPAGTAGNPTFVLANDLAALEGLASTGIAVRTATDAWAQRSVATASSARITVTNGSGVAGDPTLDLATVTDVGGGTLQKTAFDTYGRKTGTSAATTDNLTEGVTNLYFTAARVLSTVLTGLSTATNAVITAADTVLSALGKLQAQITANAAVVSGLVIDSIADADTTHAPSRNAVFDALALTQPLDSDLTTIAALTPTNDDVIQRKAGAWINRTMAQLKTDLVLIKSDVGLSNVDNTSDVNKPVSTAQQTALDAKMPNALAVSGTNVDYTYVAVDANVARGKTTSTVRTYTVDASVLTVGAYYYAANYASTGNVTVAPFAGTTLRLTGTATTGNRTVAPLGLARIWIRSATEAWVDGPGVT